MTSPAKPATAVGTHGRDLYGPLNAQHEHWEEMFAQHTDMFGTEPSYPARKAAELFKKEGRKSILELGGGQGRDTLFFALEGFQISVLDYSREGTEEIKAKADKSGLSQSVVTLQHDVRQPLPFDDDFFDGCFSHMLYCMALTTSELDSLSKEIWRVLKPQGANLIYGPHHGGPSLPDGNPSW